MEQPIASILAINTGSSSVKFALYAVDDPSKQLFAGSVAPPVALADICARIREQFPAAAISAIGHRVVGGGPHAGNPQLVDDDLLAALRALEPLYPEHLPGELRLIEECSAQFPGVPQAVCFDTGFFHDLPRVAQLLPIPRRYEAQGIRRYGYHGLSYTFLMKELARVRGAEAAGGRVILAHLGSGASLAAVRGGKPIETSMGFTPASGVPMSTRSGDLDPGIIAYLARTEGMDAQGFNKMVNQESGLIGISEISADMKTLLEQESNDIRAAEAVSLFCYQAKKYIGGLAAALGGLDMLVFAGGMGENAPKIRARICDGLGFLGIELDAHENDGNQSLISTAESKVAVLMMHTDEESVIAEAAVRILQNHG